LDQSTRIRRISIRPAVLFLAALLAAGSMIAPVTALATGNMFRVEAPSTSASPGGTFSVRVVSTTDGLLGGARASVVFDPSLLSIAAVTKGPDWVAAGATFTGFPDATVLAAANTAGKLPPVAAFFADEVTTLPAGDHDLISITFTVLACGNGTIDLPIGPTDAAFIDGSAGAYGTYLAVTGTSGGALVDPCDGQPPGTSPPPSIPPATGIVRISGTLDPGFLGLTVPEQVTIPLLRGASNTTTVPLTISSNIAWSLSVVDPDGPPNTGHMVSGGTALAAPMTAVVAPDGPVNLQAGGVLTSGLENASVSVVLGQLVSAADNPGAYSIHLVFQAMSSF
jgi:hypothetical protein